MAKNTKTKVSEELTETTEEVKAIEVVAEKQVKAKFNLDKLSSDKMIAAITKYRNSASQDATELEALANSCLE